MALSSTPESRLERARASLEGLSVGDAFGECFFSYDSAILRMVLNTRAELAPPWYYTDDTNMALSIYENLRLHGKIQQDELATSYALAYGREPGRGYGPGMHRLLPRILAGENWRDAAAALFSGQGSFGNGGAMRIAPLGAYFADDIDQAIEGAQLATEITHAHPEGVAGAIAVAVAAAVACQAKAAGERPSRAELIARVLPHLPESAVKSGVESAVDMQTSQISQVVGTLGNGSQISAQDTVPFVLYCAGEWLDDYAEALWQTASGGGDVDTTCAMVGGIVACYVGAEGIPPDWLASREPLPAWALGA